MKKVLLTMLCGFFASVGFSQTIYFSEDFEAGQGAWTTTGEWTHGAEAAQSSQYLSYAGNATSFMAFNDDAQGGAHVGGGDLISPMIDLTAVSAPLFLEANVFFANGDYQGADETFKTSVSTDGGSTWTELKDYAGLAWSVELLNLDEYAGQNVWLRFAYDDGAQWNFGCAIDDIIISDIPVNAVRRDYKLSVDGGSQFTESGQNVDYTVEGLVVNDGYEAITSFDINITTDGVTTTTSFDNLNIEKGSVYRYAIENALNTGVDFKSHTVDISNVNGEMAADEETGDNTKNIIFNPQAVHPDKGTVFEEATGAWCTWCPRGTVYMSEMSKRFPNNFIGIAVHDNDNGADAMAYDEYDDALGFGSFPSGIMNRTTELDPGEIVSPSISDMQSPPVANIAIGGEDNGGIFSGSVKVTFNQDVMGANHSVAIILTEDDLTGDGPGWNQISGGYSGGGNGPMGGFEYLPTSVPSQWWPYDHVGRALIGGFDGLNEIVGDYFVGSSPSVYFSDYPINSGWNTDNLHVIAILTDASGRIVNAVSSKYSDVVAAGQVSSNQEVLSQDFAAVYPNPVDNVAFIKMNLNNAAQVKVDLVDNLGRIVATKNYGELQGNTDLSFDVSQYNAGVYLFQIQIDNKIVTKKIQIH